MIIASTYNLAQDWFWVVPKSYRPEGQPRSAGNEFPTREVFGNSRQFQYGGFYAISNHLFT